jgi:hypothetical protein
MLVTFIEKTQSQLAPLLVVRARSNNRMQRSARTRSRMGASDRRAPADAERYTLWRVSEVAFAAPSLARTLERSVLFESAGRKRERGGGL